MKQSLYGTKEQQQELAISMLNKGVVYYDDRADRALMNLIDQDTTLEDTSEVFDAVKDMQHILYSFGVAGLRAGKTIEDAKAITNKEYENWAKMYYADAHKNL